MLRCTPKVWPAQDPVQPGTSKKFSGLILRAEERIQALQMSVLLRHTAVRNQTGTAFPLKLDLNKGFWMMKLLNRDYPAWIRAPATCLAFCLVAVITGRIVLARELARRCWTHNDFKLAARRGAWYCRRGWPNLDVSQDEFFDPTEGMTDTQLVVLEAFVQTRKPKLDDTTYTSDLAIIAARKLNNNSDTTQRHTNIGAFKAACDRLLAQPTCLRSNDARPTTARVGDFPIKKAKTTLVDFQNLFPVDQLRWFVISGTFLGLIRENGFLAHDYDIDLGVFEDEIDISDTVAKIAASNTFVLKKYDHHTSTLFQPITPSTNPEVPYILKLVHVSGIHIDLFIHYHDTSTDPAIDWHGSSLHRWENSAFDLVPYPFYDMTVLGPEDSDRYLSENYGDWRTPVTEFNCTTDTPNLALVPHPIAIVIFLKRYVLARKTDPKQATKLEMELLHNGFLQRADDGSLTFSGDLFAG